MNVAIVHELLTMRGGAERVCTIFADMFPNAPIYTLLYRPDIAAEMFPLERVRGSRLQRYAGVSTNHHHFLPAFPRAVEAWDFSEFDLVLSSSSAFAHGIITNGKPRHLSYIQSPARYLWDRTHEVLRTGTQGRFGGLIRPSVSRTFHRLRMWDSEAAERADMLVAASAEVRRRIQLYWRRESEVIHPPIDDQWLDPAENQNLKTEHPPYALLVSTLARYKHIDLAIAAANEGKFPLKIAGEGRDRARLQALAGPTVEFLGFQPTDELRRLYAGAQCTLFPGEEDFGLVPLESMACGTPVVAYRAGGALETIRENVTGLFFEEPTPASLRAAVERAGKRAWDADACRAHARRWSRSAFETAMHAAVHRCMESPQTSENPRRDRVHRV